MIFVGAELEELRTRFALAPTGSKGTCIPFATPALSLDVEIKQDGLNVEAIVKPVGESARDLAYAFDLAALGVRLALQEPGRHR